MAAMRLLPRSIRPPDPVTPNPNPPGVPPASVGPPDAVSGDPHGVVFDTSTPAGTAPPRITRPVAWDGWPAEWWTPSWDPKRQRLTDTAWTCLDLNASIFASMPPYLVGAAPSLDADWITNPSPDIYSSWDEFAKQLMWDYQLGEVFVFCSARYATGYPARFHVVPPWFVDADLVDGQRAYMIGQEDVTADMLHVRYTSTVDDAHGHGPLEAGNARLVAADVLGRYGVGLAQSGGIPPSVLTHPDELSTDQANQLKAQWIQARQSALGEPAVLSGGVTWEATQINPEQMALTELLAFNESRIAVMLAVPPFLVGLPSGGDPLTYSNVNALFDYHWRAGLRPKASMLMGALSGFLLPRGTTIEVDRDAYVQPAPLERAQTAEILNRIRDEQGNPVLSVAEIRKAERVGDQAIQAGVSP